MNRQEFIRELRKSMSGHFSASEIQETVDYYEDYIDLQMKKGRTEGEILSELGDPRLLTKSMRAAGKGRSNHEEKLGTGQRTAPSGKEPYREYGTNSDMQMNGKVIHVPCIVSLIIFVLIVLVIGTLIGAVVGLALRVVLFLLPVLLVVGGLYWLYRNFIKK